MKRKVFLLTLCYPPQRKPLLTISYVYFQIYSMHIQHVSLSLFSFLTHGSEYIIYTVLPFFTLAIFMSYILKFNSY